MKTTKSEGLSKWSLTTGWWNCITFCIDQASYDTDSKTNEVSERILVVPTDKHAGVGDEDVLQTADDGGGEGRVVAGAEDNREHQDKAEHAGEQELRYE